MENKTMVLKKSWWLYLGFFASLFLVIANGCQTEKAKSDLEMGSDLYIAYCKFCHGDTGNGGVADMLKIPPPDLTKISERRGGNFPEEEIYKIIDGTEALEAGHGSRDMPIWGETLGAAERVDEVMVPKKIYQLIEYLKSIQR